MLVLFIICIRIVKDAGKILHTPSKPSTGPCAKYIFPFEKDQNLLERGKSAAVPMSLIRLSSSEGVMTSEL